MAIEPLRVSFRRQLRATALAVAHQLTVEHGWDRVRLSEVATLAGVSRPTLYKEFGDKQGLGEALVLRETERFLVGVAAQLERHVQDLTAGIRAAVSYTLAEAEASPLLRAVLTSARGDDALLPALTTRSAPVLEAATTMLGAWLGEQLPELDRQEIHDAVDTLVRLTVSHIVLPSGGPEETANRLVQVALRYLGLEAPAPVS